MARSSWIPGAYAPTLPETRGSFCRPMEVIGPIKMDTAWHAQSGQGFAIASFPIAGETQRVICPGSQVSQVGADSRENAGHPRRYVRFAKAACPACPVHTAWTRSVKGPRPLSFKPRAQYERLPWARHREPTDECKKCATTRAGIEGTISPGTRAFGLRRSRDMGATKTHLQHRRLAVAMHLSRCVAWINGVPPSTRRTSAFADLAVNSLCIRQHYHTYAELPVYRAGTWALCPSSSLPPRDFG
jgi:transposase